jgi:hypothetical protein
MSFLQRVAAKSGAARSKMQRVFSEGSGGKVPRLSNESPIASRIFENVKQPVPIEVEAAAAAAGPSAADAAAMDLLENSTLGRVVSVFGNTLFFGGLAATSYFGYYTYKYDEEQMQRLINDKAKPENSFPGSSVSRVYMVPFLQSHVCCTLLVCPGTCNSSMKPLFSSSLPQQWVSLMSWYLEKRKNILEEMKKYADPPSDKLLPDLPPHARHIKTLVLDLDDVLVHSDWSRAR